MLVIKPYGRSVTSINPSERKLTLNKVVYPSETAGHDTTKSHSIPEFAKTDPRILIAQWIAVIDKIMKKANQSDVYSGKQHERDKTNDHLREKQINFRNKLGAECWKLIEPEIKGNKDDKDTFEKIWKWKLNPCGIVHTKFKNTGLNETNIRGGWYEAFCSKTPLQNVGFESLASQINDHLNQEERRKWKGDPRKYHEKDGDHKKIDRGLIEARALSIARNTLSLRMQERIDTEELLNRTQAVAQIEWSAGDEKIFATKGDLAAEIFKKAEEREANKGSISARDAAGLIFAHYGKQFAAKSRQDIMKDKAGLLALYDAVRSYYRVFLKNTKKGRIKVDGKVRPSSLLKVLPKKNAALFRLLAARQNNSVVNDLIRLGRVLHYESTGGDGDGFGLKKDSAIWTRDLSDIAKSAYWTSEGQSDIKRTEAFVRVWRNTITLAARTAKAIADPQSEQKDKKGKPGDVLGDGVGIALSKNTDAQKRMQAHLPLLFGREAKHFEETDHEKLLYGSLRLLATLRNQAFHFKTRRSFVEHLKEKLNSRKGDPNNQSGKAWEDTIEAFQALLKADRDGREQRLQDVITGAQIPFFCNTDQLAAFYALVSKPDESDFDLPKMNAVMQRVENKMRYNDVAMFHNFPGAASNVELKEPWRLAKFIGFRLLYDAPFRAWLKEQKGSPIQNWVEDTIKRGTKDAQDINQRDPYKALIEAKTAALPTCEDNDTIATYFDKIRAVEASEMRLQNGYESNPEAAREAMAWINDFRCDVIARAFAQYLEEQNGALNWLLNLNEKAQKNNSPAVLPAGGTATQGAEPETWLACLYYALHFVPVDDVSRLLHQFKKWSVLEEKSGASKFTAAKQAEEMPSQQASTQDNNSRDEKTKAPDPLADIEAIKQTLQLYITMHDAKHGGAGIETAGLDAFKELFDKPSSFDAVFKTEGSSDVKLTATRRGLREIMRYGDLQVLTAATSKGSTQITMADITKFKKEEKKIDKAQVCRKKLHAQLCMIKPRDVTQDQKIKYKKLVSQIDEHRHLANKVHLNYHIRLHRLLMRVASRLIDYTGLWERDGYFIALALMRLHNKTPDQVLLAGVEKFRDQGHLPPEDKDIEAGFRTILSRFHTLQHRQIRNDIDHFNFMAESDVDLTKAINDTRDLMSYDRKLKNAVTKSIKEMLLEEGLELKWTMSAAHRLEKPDVKSRTIKHLNGVTKENNHHQDYVQIVLQLFQPNLPSEKP